MTTGSFSAAAELLVVYIDAGSRPILLTTELEPVVTLSDSVKK